MQAASSRKALTFTFSSLEGRVLQLILKQIIANYQIKPDALDPKAASAWYSTRGCKTAGMSAEDTREWLEHLHQYRSANLQLLLKWLRRLSVSKAGHHQLCVKLEEAPALLTALNDHRLLLAARHDIGETEMDARGLNAMTSLPVAQQIPVAEIHFLAYIIEEVLHFLPGNPGGWMEAL